MRVIPVIDLMRGQVVRGVGGRRDEYRAIESKLVPDARPVSVGRALATAGFSSIYVADLDAIGGALPAWSIYGELLAAGLELWVDAGVRDAAQAETLARFVAGGQSLSAIVAGLESLSNPAALTEVIAVVGRERLIFSLDLKAGQPIADRAGWHDLAPLEIAKVALRAGVRRMIILDLAQVGMGQGVGTEPLCRALRCVDPDLQIIAGGGVRSTSDLRSLERAGCDAALVASALHDGRLPVAECAGWHEQAART